MRVREARMTISASDPEQMLHVKVESERPVKQGYLFQGRFDKGRREITGSPRELETNPADKLCVMAVGANNGSRNTITVTDVTFDGDATPCTAALDISGLSMDERLEWLSPVDRYDQTADACRRSRPRIADRSWKSMLNGIEIPCKCSE